MDSTYIPKSQNIYGISSTIDWKSGRIVWGFGNVRCWLLSIFPYWCFTPAPIARWSCCCYFFSLSVYIRLWQGPMHKAKFIVVHSPYQLIAIVFPKVYLQHEVYSGRIYNWGLPLLVNHHFLLEIPNPIASCWVQHLHCPSCDCP